MYKTTTFYKIPRAVSPDVDYVKQDGLSEADHSPTPKKKRVIRPQREPGATRIKSDSFCTEPPSMRPLRRSTRLSKPVDTSKNTETLDHSASSPVPKLPASNPPSVGSSWGTFTAQSFGIKKNRKPWKFSCKLCDYTCGSIKELMKHHQQMHNNLYCEMCSKAFNTPVSLVSTNTCIKTSNTSVKTVINPLPLKAHYRDTESVTEH